MVWAHTHSDEILVIFGFLFVLGLGLGSFFPSRFVASGVVLGVAPLAAELLVHFGVLHPKWPATPLGSLPVIALVLQLPANLGAALGWAMRLETKPGYPVS